MPRLKVPPSPTPSCYSSHCAGPKAWPYLNISKAAFSKAAFKIAGGIILFLVALAMLATRRQLHECEDSTSGGNTREGVPGAKDSGTDNDSDNLAIYPLAISLLAGQSAIILAGLSVQYVIDGLTAIGIASL